LLVELNAFASGEKGYRSRVAPEKKNVAGHFDHLARVGEWSLRSSSEDGNEEDEA
jgi:hypothetical protein